MDADNAAAAATLNPHNQINRRDIELSHYKVTADRTTEVQPTAAAVQRTVQDQFRCKLLVHRARSREHTSMVGPRAAGLALQETSRELVAGDARIRLQEQPFQILQLLLARAGAVITRDELRERLWPNGTFVDFEHSLNAAVKRLRAALGDDAKAPRYIETLPRRGYRWIASTIPVIKDQLADGTAERIQIVWN